MSLNSDQLAAVRDLIAVSNQRPNIGGREAKAFVGTIDAETGLPSMGGGTLTERSVSLVALNDNLVELKRDLPVVISPSVRVFRVESWERHEGFTVIECR